MSDRAEVSSIDAISDFRTALLVYISKVRPLLDDSADEVFRMREWLRTTQWVHWENQLRHRTRELEDAQQALFSAEMAKLRPATHAEVVAVQKARRALAHVEEKLRTLKQVASMFEKEAVPRLKQIESLRSVVGNDLMEGVHFLERIVGSLDKYVNTPATAGPQPRVETPVPQPESEEGK
ncbi:MAG TPA: hypothetical protein VF773_07235 [Verrucomicrobiae bacterium]